MESSNISLPAQKALSTLISELYTSPFNEKRSTYINIYRLCISLIEHNLINDRQLDISQYTYKIDGDFIKIASLSETVDALILSAPASPTLLPKLDQAFRNYITLVDDATKYLEKYFDPRPRIDQSLAFLAPRLTNLSAQYTNPPNDTNSSVYKSRHRDLFVSNIDGVFWLCRATLQDESVHVDSSSHTNLNKLMDSLNFAMGKFDISAIKIINIPISLQTSTYITPIADEGQLDECKLFYTSYTIFTEDGNIIHDAADIISANYINSDVYVVFTQMKMIYYDMYTHKVLYEVNLPTINYDDGPRVDRMYPQDAIYSRELNLFYYQWGRKLYYHDLWMNLIGEEEVGLTYTIHNAGDGLIALKYGDI
jgi:hypothetical protein